MAASGSLDNYPNTGEFPSDGVSIRSAATMVLLDDRPDLHVLALHRTELSTFVAGHTLFPGGSLEPDDRAFFWRLCVRGRKLEDVDKSLGVGPGSVAFWVAAIRETLEEVGVAIGCSASLVPHREDLASGRSRLSDLIDLGIGLDIEEIYPVARWVTPMGQVKRYDTQFFVTRLPVGAVPVADGVEAVSLQWIRPIDAIDQWKAGELTMISPTVSIFQRLSGYRDSAEVISAVSGASNALRERVRIVDESQSLVLFPEDPDYLAQGTREALGWVWMPPFKHSLP